MNEYKIVKVHGEGQYPFTYRGKTGFFEGVLGKILIFH